MPEAWAAELDRRFSEACRAAEKRFERRQLAQAIRRAAADARARDRSARRATRRTTTFAASGIRCASSGRRSRAMSRSTPSCARATTPRPQTLEAQEQTHRDAKGQQQVENLQRLQALVQKFETRAVRRKPHAQADRSADEGRQAGGRHDGAAAGQAGSRRPDGAPAGGAHVVDAAHPGAARSRGVEALGQRPGAGRAVRARWKRSSRSPRPIRKKRRTKCARCRNGGSPSPRRRDRRPRRCGRASRPRRSRSTTSARTSSRSRPTERVENLKKKEALCLRAESMADSTDWVKTADAMKTLQAEWKADRPGHARQREGGVGALPRGVRQVLHAPPGRSQAAQAGLDREPQAQGSAGRRSEAAVGIDRVGAGRVAHQAPAGRLEDDRPGQEEQVGRDLERVPRRVRPVLRALQEPRFRRRCRARWPIANRRSPSSRRCCPPPMRPTPRRRTISTRRCRPRARAGCRDRSCRGTRSRRWPSASTPRSSLSSPAGPTASRAPTSIRS